MQKPLNIGGQAVIEGVMIRGPSKYSVAVRKGKQIVSKSWNLKKNKLSFYKWPFVRGFVNLAEMLGIGMKSLIWSAEQALPDEEKAGKNDILFAVITSIVLVIVFFIALPYFLTGILGFSEEQKPIMFNLVDGAIRIAIFVLYVFAISYMKDVKTMFRYHGAEHKAIHCYEHGKKLDVKNVQSFTTLHPRCGTSFLFIVFMVSILVFSVLPSLMIYLNPNFNLLGVWARRLIMFPVRILLIPLIAGISYEILKMSDKKQNNIIFKIISLPGLMLQKITTQKPTNKQVEVAIASLNKLLAAEAKK